MAARRGLTRSIVLAIIILLVYINHSRRSTRASTAASTLRNKVLPVFSKSPGKHYQPVLLSGYVYPGPYSQTTCDKTSFQAQIGAQPSWNVTDDLAEIVAEIGNHPTVDYSTQDQSLSHEEIVAKTWARMAHSSIWMEHYQVYLTVSRVFYYDKGVRKWSVMSFLRGQIHDGNWNELKDYTLEWEGRSIHFPRVFDIPADFIKGDCFQGPEDPRITIDTRDKHNPEPIIVFNMMPNMTTKASREMWIFKPFSNETTMLQLKDKSNGNTSEKNWMPFIFAEEGASLAKGQHNPYIHFVYGMKDLQIIKCAVSDGSCYYVFKQDLPKDYDRNKIDGLTGGTNLVPIEGRDKGSQAFIGFPRTHLRQVCKDGFYRPQLMVLVSTSPTHWHIEYLSDSLDFDEAGLTYSGKEDDPCDAGRIMIINSVARWENTWQDDVITVTFSIDDVTTQNLRLKGVSEFISGVQKASKPTQRESLRRADGQVESPRLESKILVTECAMDAARKFEKMEFDKMMKTVEQQKLLG